MNMTNRKMNGMIRKATEVYVTVVGGDFNIKVSKQAALALLKEAGEDEFQLIYDDPSILLIDSV